MTRILVVAGPTATGKSGAAIALAQALDGEIVSADSVLVYGGFDVGSAKPTPAERAGVPHHVIDVLDPEEHVDAVRYAAIGDDAITAIAARGRLPIVVGGTGLWIRALVRGLVTVPPVDPDVRARLEREADTAGTPALHARLATVDPASAAKVHANDRLRVVRALEIFEQTGRPASELRRAHALGAPRYDNLFVVLEEPKEVLAARITARTRAMIEAGLPEEVRELLARHDAGVRPFGAVGYAEMVAHVRDGVLLDETERRIVKSTRVYARRQRLWWKGEPGVHVRTTADALRGAESVAELATWRDRSTHSATAR